MVGGGGGGREEVRAGNSEVWCVVSMTDVTINVFTFFNVSLYILADSAARYPQCLPMISWMTSMRGEAEDSLTTFEKKDAEAMAAVIAPRVWVTG